jgi:hypothetical protein
MARLIDQITKVVWDSLTEDEYQALLQSAAEWKNMPEERQREIAGIFTKVIRVYDASKNMEAADQQHDFRGA